jgi:hypothetical protein
MGEIHLSLLVASLYSARKENCDRRAW